jgi:Transposase DDE domain group 1
LGKPVIAKFDQEHASSDGGAILLQACDRRLGLSEAMIGAIDDRRQSVIYCARANIENRIKELHHGLEIDRTSCTRFLANQLRGLLTSALRLHSAVGLTPRSLTMFARDSRRTPVPKSRACTSPAAKIERPRPRERQNHRSASTSRILESMNTKTESFMHSAG